MIEPGHRLIDGLDRSAPRGSARPAQHDHLDAERARCRDLAVGRGAAAVLGDHDIDADAASSSARSSRFDERPAAGDIDRHAAAASGGSTGSTLRIEIMSAAARRANGASSLRPSATKTRRGVAPSARTAAAHVGDLESSGRRRPRSTAGGAAPRNGTPVIAAAAPHWREMRAA